MATSRFLKTPKLQIVLQLTEVKSAQGRLWEVHDIERNRGFRVSLPAVRTALRRADDDVDKALGLAIEHALVTPPEKVSGSALRSHDHGRRIARRRGPPLSAASIAGRPEPSEHLPDYEKYIRLVTGEDRAGGACEPDRRNAGDAAGRVGGSTP